MACPHNLPEGRIIEFMKGIQRDAEGNPRLILWECLCKTSVAICWEKASPEMREAAEKMDKGV